jgi:hypothetical protein
VCIDYLVSVGKTRGDVRTFALMVSRFTVRPSG